MDIEDIMSLARTIYRRHRAHFILEEDDAVQEATLRCWELRDRLDPDRPAKPFYFSVIKWKYNELCRNAGRRIRAGKLETDISEDRRIMADTHAIYPPEPAPPPYEKKKLLSKAKDYTVKWRRLNGKTYLPKGMARARDLRLWVWHLRGCTGVELAHKFGIDESHVCKTIKRMRKVYRLADESHRAKAPSNGLREDDVINILRDTRSAYKVLAARYGVSVSMISKIKGRKRWKHVQA